MLHAFIDESEYKDKYFILSALIVADDKLEQLNSALSNLLLEYQGVINIASNVELHGYDLLQQKGDWKSVHMNVAASIYKKALGIINQHGAAIYIETIDREEQRCRYRYVFSHRRIAMGYILETVNE